MEKHQPAHETNTPDVVSGPAIARLVAHHNGAIALSRLLGGKPTYQEIQRWVKRGWASPAHLFSLEPLLPDGITLKQLSCDRMAAKRAAAQVGA